MPSVLFKLKYGQSIRRVSFQNLPTWADLAGKLQALYNLPLETIAVSYIDSDNDEITVSSNEELQDYYNTTFKLGESVKFNILDLSASKDVTPPTVNRNTFGADAFDLIEPDWHRVNPANLGELDFTRELSLDGPHAFVEVVNSDVSTMDQGGDSDSEDERSTARAPFLDKGKRKASSMSLGAASVTSLVAEEAAEKFPIHVFDHNSAEPPLSAQQQAAESLGSEASFSHSTPKAPTKDVEMTEATQKPIESEDPPLPSIEDQPSNPSPNFSSDIVALLTAFTTIISTHPELSEGVRNIVQNATNGAYWQAHRSALSEAVDEMAQATAAHARNVEAEAAERVYSALGNMFRSLSAAGAPSVAEAQPAAQSSNDPPETQNFEPWWSRGPHAWNPSSLGALREWGPQPQSFNFFRRGPHGAHHPHRGVFPHFGYPYPPPGMHHPPPPPPGMHHPPPPPPPHMPHPPPPPPVQPEAVIPPVPSTGLEHSAPVHGEPHAATPPLPGAFPHDQHHFRHMRGGPHSHRHSLPPRPLPHPRAGPSSFTNPFLEGESAQKPTPEELKARVEKAKEEYRSQKQAYRRQREERRKTKDSPVEKSVSPEDLNLNPEMTQVVSNAWGSYPQVEMFSVPKRANTLPSHSGLRRVNRDGQDDLNTRAINRIARKMADMGFTENSHPDLLTKIKSSMPVIGTISKEGEDDIVTNLLEDLIPSSPPRASAPVASGSTLTGPGSWQ